MLALLDGKDTLTAPYTQRPPATIEGNLLHNSVKLTLPPAVDMSAAFNERGQYLSDEYWLDSLQCESKKSP